MEKARSSTQIPFDISNHLPKIVVDYLQANNWFSEEKLKSDILQKTKGFKFSDDRRQVLTKVLQEQYKSEGLSPNQKLNLEKLNEKNFYFIHLYLNFSFFK